MSYSFSLDDLFTAADAILKYKQAGLKSQESAERLETGLALVAQARADRDAGIESYCRKYFREWKIRVDSKCGEQWHFVDEYGVERSGVYKSWSKTMEYPYVPDFILEKIRNDMVCLRDSDV